MNKEDLPNGKKLNKRELRAIKGGLKDCIDPQTGGCRIISIGCAQLQCRPELP
ncbi:hypothetical protein [Chryseobacterium sp. FH2]|uniref:hypothetical protein n=1 Tax=Chryseobacterium sp. FH2 TaxID=1674291 RepID=UPI000AD77F4A|nr:hypothetical protein [Chryseobacterium sp. FH2]